MYIKNLGHSGLNKFLSLAIFSMMASVTKTVIQFVSDYASALSSHNIGHCVVTELDITSL